MRICLFLSLSLFALETLVLGYNDEELICPPGYAVASLNRNSAFDNGPLAGSCRPLLSGTLKLKDTKCERREPLQCRNKFEKKACLDNEWMGGVLSYQLNTTRANLIIPICCSSEHVQMSNESCQVVRLNEFLEPIKYRVPPGQAITRIKCHYIVDQSKDVLDATLHVQVCPYQVADARPLTRSTSAHLKTTTEQSSISPQSTISNAHELNSTRSSKGTTSLDRSVATGKSTTVTPESNAITKTTLVAARESTPRFESESPNETKAQRNETSSELKQDCPPCQCKCPPRKCPIGATALTLELSTQPSVNNKTQAQGWQHCKCQCICTYKCDE